MEREESQTSSPTADQDTIDYFNSTYPGYIYTMSNTDLIGWITLCIELPVLCWAIFALYHQVKANHVAPVFIINLLISDILQIIGRFGFLLILFWLISFDNYNDAPHTIHRVSWFLVKFGITSSVGFMVCISLERYLMVVYPLWYRFHCTIKYSIFTSLAVWVFSVILAYLAQFFHYNTTIPYFIFMMFPLPFLVFFLVGTWRSLSRSISVPVKEKKRILCILVLVLGIYIVLFLPCIVIVSLFLFSIPIYDWDNFNRLHDVALVFVYINPLMDPLLYIFLKKDVPLKALPFCGRLIGHQQHRETSSVQTQNVTSV